VRRLGLLLAATLVACESAVTASPSPTATATLSASPTASSSPITAREETPRLLLSIPYAPLSVESVGATATRIGGVTPRGPASLAVDENDRIYIWDRARLRVAVYGGGKFERAIAVPYVEQDAGGLLLDGGRVYLRAVTQLGTLEYEIDGANGALVRAASSANSSIYPRRRTSPQPAAARPTFGADAAGLDYVYATIAQNATTRYERVDLARGALAYALEPAPEKLVDAYVRADGALFELAADYGGVGSVYVYVLLSPSGAARPPSPPPAAPAAPEAFGRPVPDRLTATLAGAGSVDLDAQSRMAVWWLASLAKERTDLPAPPYGPLLLARWNDGSKLDMVVDASLLFVDGKIYTGPAAAYQQVASYALASPSRLAELTARGATIRIPDLPSVQRVLTTAEIADLRKSLSIGFTVSEGELPFMLEDPFPLYEIALGDVVIRIHGDDYGSVGKLRTGAFVHDGTLDDLARRWLPVPTLSVGDPRSLFLADTVVLDQVERGGAQDITRWKASIVRALSAVTPPEQSEFVQVKPFTFTFRFTSGRTETVQVRPGAFTYRGRVIPLAGALNLSLFGGVP
jgi:hypothetical protein